jgi:hypothetical protein
MYKGIIYIELIRGTDVIYHCGQVKPDLYDMTNCPHFLPLNYRGLKRW